MATQRLTKPIAFLFDLPMDHAEAHAFSAFEAGVDTPEQRRLLLAWVVKMTMIHGTWVADRLGRIKMETRS
jgi:hypothetical protein